MQGIMLVVTYIAIVAVGLALAIGMGLVTDRVNAPASLLVFFAVAACTTALAWPLAVRLTEPAA